MAPSFGPLIDAAWLADHREEPDVRVIDFRWYLDGRSGRAAYDAGHVPGAAFVDLEEVTGHASGAGRHPLPDGPAFERAMRAAGVGRGSRVVAYDDQGGYTAARLWWLLRYFGHDAAAVLDGGIQGWRGPLTAGSEKPAAGDFLAGPPREQLKVDYEALRESRGDLVLLDARAPERYRGAVEPVDPRAGHIPGARSAHYRGNLDATLRLLPAEVLRPARGPALPGLVERLVEPPRGPCRHRRGVPASRLASAGVRSPAEAVIGSRSAAPTSLVTQVS